MVHIIFDSGDLRFENFYQSSEGISSPYFEGLPIIKERGTVIFQDAPSFIKGVTVENAKFSINLWLHVKK